jgi:hypothetical protein
VPRLAARAADAHLSTEEFIAISVASYIASSAQITPNGEKCVLFRMNEMKLKQAIRTQQVVSSKPTAKYLVISEERRPNMTVNLTVTPSSNLEDLPTANTYSPRLFSANSFDNKFENKLRTKPSKYRAEPWSLTQIEAR